MNEMTVKIIDALFIVRTMGEKIYAGKATPKDIRKAKKKVNSVLKEIEKMVKEGEADESKKVV